MGMEIELADAVTSVRDKLSQSITTVRDAAGADAGVRNAVRDGLIAGPRIQISVAMMSQTGGHGDLHMLCGVQPALTGPGGITVIADGPDAVRRLARELIRAGADSNDRRGLAVCSRARRQDR